LILRDGHAAFGSVEAEKRTMAEPEMSVVFSGKDAVLIVWP